MRILVQKFGGTSLQNEAGRLMALEKIRSAIEEGFSPVIVVSAIGRKGDPYSTDTLIDEAKKCLIDIKKREKDLLTSCGEIISAVLMVQRLRAAKLDAIALTGFQAGIITDDNFGNARVNKVNPSKILSCLQNGKIPVIAGYQGISESFEITTLGRGGSDTTAAIVAAALKADKIEIYSDVNGLMTADPTIVESAILLNEASYEEVVEFAHKGAKVIHPVAVEISHQAEIPLHILSNFNKSAGTLVHNVKSYKPVTGVTSNDKIVFFKINSITSAADLLQELAIKSISLDMIDIQPGSLSFLVDSSYSRNLQTYFTANEHCFEVNENLSKISVVGSGMSGLPGVIARIASALQMRKIEIFKSMDSHTAISCLILKENTKKAVETLHKEFNLEKL